MYIPRTVRHFAISTFFFFNTKSIHQPHSSPCISVPFFTSIFYYRIILLNHLHLHMRSQQEAHSLNSHSLTMCQCSAVVHSANSKSSVISNPSSCSIASIHTPVVKLTYCPCNIHSYIYFASSQLTFALPQKSLLTRSP